MLTDSLKILLMNRDEKTHVGGDMLRLRNYQKELRRMGYNAAYCNDPSVNIDDFDIVWLFHMDFGWALENYQLCKNKKKPYILFPNYYSHLNNVSHQDRQNIVSDAKFIIVTSQTEKLELLHKFRVDSSKIGTVPNGVDREIFSPNGSRFEIDSPYVLSVGRFEPYKGHLRVIKACKAAGVSVIAIGPHTVSSYVDQCRGEFYEKAIIKNGVSQAELARYYRGAEIFVCASTTERNCNCVVEALACGTKVISSVYNKGNEWYQGMSIIDPTKHEEMVDTILMELSNEEECHVKVASWHGIVRDILDSVGAAS
jgi:glycosyltransferase involved in cell wall biosynthesis